MCHAPMPPGNLYFSFFLAESLLRDSFVSKATGSAGAISRSSTRALLPAIPPAPPDPNGHRGHRRCWRGSDSRTRSLRRGHRLHRRSRCLSKRTARRRRRLHCLARRRRTVAAGGSEDLRGVFLSGRPAKLFVPVHLSCLTEADFVSLQPRMISPGGATETVSGACRIKPHFTASALARKFWASCTEPWARLHATLLLEQVPANGTAFPR